MPDDVGVALGDAVAVMVGVGESLAIGDALALGVGVGFVARAEVQPARTIVMRLVAPSTGKRKPMPDATDQPARVVRPKDDLL